VISLLHRPIYTYSQVDRLLGLTSGTARRWINGYRRGRRIYEPIIRPESRNTTWVTWGEYVEARLLANWRDLDNLPIPSSGGWLSIFAERLVMSCHWRPTRR